MEEIKNKIKSFTDLNAWKEGHKLVIARGLNYLEQKDFRNIAEQTISVNKLINGLKRIKSLDTIY